MEQPDTPMIVWGDRIPTAQNVSQTFLWLEKRFESQKNSTSL